jgi:hypothetical protein
MINWELNSIIAIRLERGLPQPLGLIRQKAPSLYNPSITNCMKFSQSKGISFAA